MRAWRWRWRWEEKLVEKRRTRKGQGNNVGRMSFLTAARVPARVERGKPTLPNAAAYTAATD